MAGTRSNESHDNSSSNGLGFKNNDVEGYRTTVKKQIKDWHSVVTARRHQEWLILHIIRPDKRPQGGNFFHLSSVFEKIRTDFNTEKKERYICCNAYFDGSDPNLAACKSLGLQKPTLQPYGLNSLTKSKMVFFVRSIPQCTSEKRK